MEKKHTIKKIIISALIITMTIVIGLLIYEIVTVNNKYYIGEKNIQIPIFVYHDIVKNENEIEFEYMQTTAETFENQLIGLMKLGYKPITYDELLKYNNNEIPISKWNFIVTFDDGYEGVYDYAYPIAKKYQIPMTIFEVDSSMEKEGCLTWKQAKEMKESGLFEIYSHGYEHLEYDKETTEKLVELTNNSYQNIVKNLEDDNILKVFTYPYGLYREDEIEALAKEGFIQNLTDNKVNQSNKLDLHRLHRCYPLSDSVFKIILKIQYRSLRYGG